MTFFDFSTRLIIAFILGAAIGTERQWRQRMAGLRTNMLVCIGACMFVILGVKEGGDAAGRVISYVVSGIGFLGAGVIMKDGLNVRGLNTAATLWCSAAVGASCGTGFIMEAGFFTTLIILTHMIMRPLGVKLSRLPLKNTHVPVPYVLIIKCRQDVENHLRVLLLQFTGNDSKLLLRSLKSTDDGDPSIAIITAEIFANSNEDTLMEKIAGRLTIEKQVSEISWNKAGDENDL
ncbi:putative Mg2+ transporter-C (MgtC) family protein [Pedobacter sp. AK013]|uniref:MgtC/SapB family protein n=1 Tax=Pedobacter sp. AK013 TaxID=2723071 RepID=UPI00160EFF2D|nr:MgtC/SapB family protein [Pedobacter sp. AK013]MBB6237497.1 putative Mg2+ transporter-C (MgtC) family protein [Pedobacter sp. AK013]